MADRNEAVASLEELMVGAVSGRGHVAIVSGTVGTGKSTLLHSFADRVVDLGALAIVATGSRSERNLPMGVLNQLFRDAPLLAGERSRVSDLLCEGGRMVTSATGGGEVGPVDAQIMHALCTVLIELSERYPLAIIVDDAHEADRLSLVFLSYLARRVRFAQMLAVFGHSEHGQATESSLHTELMRSQSGKRIRLLPLTEAGVQAMAAARVGSAVAERFAATWHSLSGGNPVLLSGLLDDHQTATAGGSEAPAVAVIGDGYGQAVVSCLHRGDQRTLEVGRGLAVLAEPEPVDRLLEVDPDLVAQSIRGLTAAGVLSLGRFRHPAARSAVLADMDAAALADLYRRAASLAYERGAPPRIVAEQLLHAGGGGEPWAVAVLEDAARQALRDGRVEPAVAYLRLAWQECTDDQRRGKIMMTLVRAEWLINPSMPTKYFSQLSDSLHKGHLRGDDAVGLAGVLLWHGSFDEAREVFEHLDSSGDRQDQETRAELAVTRPWLRCTYPGFLERLPATPAGPAMATVTTVAQSRRLEAATALLEMLECRSTSDSFATVERILRGSGLAGMTMDTVDNSLLALIYGGRVEQAGPWCDLFLEEAQQRRMPSRLARLSALRAEIALRLGDLPAAARHAHRALEIIPPSSWGVSVGGPLATLVQAATAMGNYDEVRDRLDQPVPEAMFETRYGLSYLHARGRYSLATGHASLAMRDFRRCGELMEAWALDTPELVSWRIDAAEACLARGVTEKAGQLLEKQLGRCGDQPRVKGMALRLHAATRLPRHRPMLLRHAADLLQSCGDRYQLACALSSLAEAYEVVGESRRASTIARRARALAEDCHAKLPGAASPEPHEPAGDPPQSAIPAGPAALLSDAERRVAALAAVGYTNREISDKLYVTISTVEQHLTRVYRKLEVTSRADLPSDLDLAPTVAA